jgi:hypothetical protein
MGPRLLFLVTLTIIAAVAVLAGSIAEVSAANVPTRVTVDSCARHGRPGVPGALAG